MTAVYILLNLFWQWLAWIEIRSDERIKQESSPPPHGRPLGFVNGGGYDIRPLSPFRLHWVSRQQRSIAFRV
jgi:hypothetical protein